MARLAGGAQAALVKVLVAGNTPGGYTKVGAVQVLFLDRRAFLRRDVRGIVALVAGHPSVLALKQISGFSMVESLGVPLNKGEVFTVVFGVAAGALLARAGRDVVGRVKPLVGGQAGGDFGVAFHAFEGCLTAKFVTARAIGGPVQRLVRPR